RRPATPSTRSAPSTDRADRGIRRVGRAQRGPRGTTRTVGLAALDPPYQWITMPKFVVIGSNCFTGSHVVDALLPDPANEVVRGSRSPEYRPLFLPYKARDTRRFRFHQIDTVRSLDRLLRLLEDERPEVVIHVAALSEVALSNERPVEYFETNTLSVVKLCNHLRTRPYLRRYVHISSAEEFGPCDPPIHQHTPIHPLPPSPTSHTPS